MFSLFLGKVTFPLTAKMVFAAMFAAAPAQERAMITYDSFQCLYKNIHYEASGESPTGKVWVGLVTQNRVASPMFPDTTCRVVYQPYQFSWTLDSTKAHKPVVLNNTIELEDFKETLQIAYMIYTQKIVDSTNNSMYYYAHNKIDPPYWADELRLVDVIGGHTFLKH